MRRVTLVIVLLVVAAGAWWGLHGRHDAPPATPPAPVGERAPAARERVAPDRAGTPAPSVGEPVTAETPPMLDALRAAMTAGDASAAQDAAAALRGLLRSDPDAWTAAAALVGDPAQATALRGAVALVLGTIDTPRTDEVLRAALPGAPAELARALVLALGATREPPDDDEVFDLGDNPWGEHGPGGLGITVRRGIEDPATRAVLAGVLHAEDVELRRVAAVALRHSLREDDVRAAFTAALHDEREDAPLSEVAEAFAVGARGAAPDARDAFLRALVERAAEPGLDGTRFRVIDDLHRVPLPPDVAARLRELALGAGDFPVRAFALDLLAAAAESQDDATVGTARETLTRVLALDTDAALRDTAARHLRTVPTDEAAVDALLQAARTDAAWNVRYTAIETLAALGGTARDAALRAGNADSDERVRALAADLASRR